MAAKLRWLSRASRHLDDIHHFLSPRNARAADEYTDQIISACEGLRDFPQSGPAYDTKYRSLVVRNHIVFYSFDENRGIVRIVAILDGRRDVASIVKHYS